MTLASPNQCEQSTVSFRSTKSNNPFFSALAILVLRLYARSPDFSIGGNSPLEVASRLPAQVHVLSCRYLRCVANALSTAVDRIEVGSILFKRVQTRGALHVSDYSPTIRFRT